MSLLLRTPSREEVRARGPYAFDDDLVTRLMELTAVAVAHNLDRGLFFGYLLDLKSNLVKLDTRLESVAEAVNQAGKRLARRGIARPLNVALVVDITSKGNLRVSYVPEHPRDFGHTDEQYRHHGGHDPINTLLFVKDFERLWAAQSKVSADPDEDFQLAFLREVLITVVTLTEYAAARLVRCCDVISRWRFARESSGRFALLSPQELEERAQAVAAEREKAALDAVEAPDRENLRRWTLYFGMEPARIIAIVQSFSPCRVPFSGRVKILRRHFDLKGSPSGLDPGIVRSMKNTLARLGIPLPKAEIPLEEARWLAQHYLGKIRERPSKATRK
jgi:hypothetical protein